jgi:hypothetical protein
VSAEKFWFVLSWARSIDGGERPRLKKCWPWTFLDIHSRMGKSRYIRKSMAEWKMYGATFICGGGGEHEIPRNFVSFYFDLFDALLVPRPGCQGRESHRNWSNEFIFQTNVSINLHRGEKSENIFILFHRVNKKRNSKTSRITQTSALSSHLMPPPIDAW